MSRTATSLLRTLTRHLGTIGMSAIALMLFAAPASASAATVPLKQPSLEGCGGACCSACTVQDPQSQRAKPSPKQPSRPTDSTKLWMEVYTGNDYTE